MPLRFDKHTFSWRCSEVDASASCDAASRRFGLSALNFAWIAAILMAGCASPASSDVASPARPARAVQVPEPGKTQMEGLAYSHDGAYFLVADEQGDANSELTIVEVGP